MSEELILLDRSDEALHAAYERLPLSDTTLERNQLTGAFEHVAPAGQTFSMSGRFTIRSDQAEVIDWSYPVDSLEKILYDHPDDFPKFLAEAEGNESLAKRLLHYAHNVNDNPSTLAEREDMTDDDVIVTFEGRRLSFRSIASNGLGAITVFVKGDVQGWAESAMMGIRLPCNSAGLAIETHWFDIPLAHTAWLQLIAEGPIEDVDVSLIHCANAEPFLQIETYERRDTELWLPLSRTGPAPDPLCGNVIVEGPVSKDLDGLARELRRYYEYGPMPLEEEDIPF